MMVGYLQMKSKCLRELSQEHGKCQRNYTSGSGDALECPLMVTRLHGEAEM